MKTLFLTLVAALGSDDYASREATDRVLSNCRGSRESYTTLSRLADTHADPEVRARCRRLATRHLADAVDALCPYACWPPISCTTLQTWEDTWTVLFVQRADCLCRPHPCEYGPPDPEFVVAEQRQLKGEVMRYVRQTGVWPDTLDFSDWIVYDQGSHDEPGPLVAYDPADWFSNLLNTPPNLWCRR